MKKQFQLFYFFIVNGNKLINRNAEGTGKIRSNTKEQTEIMLCKN